MSDDSTVALDFVTEHVDETIRALAEVKGGLQDIAGEPQAAELIVRTDEAVAALEQVKEVKEQVAEGLRTPEELRVAAEPAVAALRRVDEGVAAVQAHAAGLGPALTAGTSRGEAAAAAAAVQFKKTTGAVDDLERAAARGGRGFVVAGSVARVAIQELKAKIDEARTGGGPVNPAWEQDVKKLEASVKAATDRAGQFRLANQQQQEELKRSAVAAGAYRGQVSSLTEAIGLKFPAAQQALIGFGASVAVFETAYRATRQFVDFLKSTFDIDLDKAPLAQLGRIAGQSLGELGQAERKAEQENELLRNSLHILTAEVGSAPVKIEEAAAAWDRYSEKLRRARAQQNIDTAGFEEFFGALQGSQPVDKLTGKLAELNGVLTTLGGNQSLGALAKNLGAPIDYLARLQLLAKTSQPAFNEFAKQVDATGAALQKFGPLIRQGLDGDALKAFDKAVADFNKNIRDNLEKLPSYVAYQTAQIEAAFGVQTAEQVQKSIAALKDYIRIVSAAGPATKEQADRIAAEYAKIEAAIKLLPLNTQVALGDSLTTIKRYVDDVKPPINELLKSFGVTMPEDIDKGIKKLREYAVALGPIGRLSKEEAQSVVAEAEKQLTAIARLPVAQQKAYEKTAETLRGVVAAYKDQAEKTAAFAEQGAGAVVKASAEAVKALDAQIAGNQKLAKSARDTAKELADSLRTKEKAQQPGNVGSQADQEELAGLRSKVQLSPEEAARQRDLEDKLLGTQRAAKSGATANQQLADSHSKVSASAEEVAKSVQSYRAQMEAEEKTTKTLTALQREAINVELERLQQNAAAGQATASSIEASFEAIARIRDKAAADAKSLKGDVEAQGKAAEAQLKQSGAQVATLGDQAKAVANVQSQVAGVAKETAAAGEAASGAAAATKELGKEATTAGDSAAAAGAGYIAMGDKVIAVQGAAESASGGIIRLHDSTKACSSAADDAATKMQHVADQARGQASATDDATRSTDKHIDALGQWAEKQKLVGDTERNTTEITIGAKKNVDDLTASTGKVAPKMEEAAAGVQKLVEPLKTLSDLHIGDQFKPLADLLAQAAKFQDLATAVDTFVKRVGGIDAAAYGKKIDQIIKANDKLIASEEAAIKIANQRLEVMRQEMELMQQMIQMAGQISGGGPT